MTPRGAGRETPAPTVTMRPHLIRLRGDETGRRRRTGEGAARMRLTGASGPGNGDERRGGGRRALRALAVIALPLLLAACGQDDPATNEPAVATVAPTIAATTVAPTTAPEVPAVAPGTSASPGASPGATPVGSGALTLGTLVDRVDQAWAGVDSYRARFVAGPADGTPVAVASPVAAGTVSEAVREVVRPDRQRQVVRTSDGAETEAIAIGNRLWVRGALAGELRPDAAPDAWIEVEAPAAGATGAFAGLSSPPASPLSGFPENLRPQEVRPLGPVEVDGRTCEGYGAAATTQFGDRIDYTISLGPDDLPCAIESRVGQVVSRTVYDAYGDPLAIEPPATALPPASPVAVATPATPVGRD